MLLGRQKDHLAINRFEIERQTGEPCNLLREAFISGARGAWPLNIKRINQRVQHAIALPLALKNLAIAAWLAY